jgi:NAD-dependent DNA ligase
MKKFLMAAIAVFMMAGTAVATENHVEVKSDVAMTQQENVADKLIALIKDYTKKINAAKTIDELIQVSEQCYNEMMDFQKKYEKEIMALEGTLTEAQQAAYEKKIEAAMAEFEAAIEKKTEELIGDYEFE